MTHQDGVNPLIAEAFHECPAILREERLAELKWTAGHITTASNSTTQEKLLAHIIIKLIEEIV
jgi:hypothetical protein